MIPFHPLANLFPLIEGKAFDDLVADIGRNGLREKIVMLDGQVLDGRNRLRAAIAADEIGAREGEEIDPAQWPDHFASFDPATQGDPLTWVLSKNLHRRHLDESQRATVAARLETFRHGGKRSAAPPSDDEGQDADLQDAPAAPPAPAIGRRVAAEMLNVSERSVASAKKVIEQGAPELVAKVEQGELAVSVAEKLVALPRERQAEIVAATPAEKLKTVAKQVKREETEKKLGQKQRDLPTRLYGAIYLDPATAFRTRSEAGMDRSAENHYPTMQDEELRLLPVGTLAAPDCALFCWTTSPKLEETLKWVRFWGFRYVTSFIWDKTDPAAADGEGGMGMGFWGRIDHEILILATRGSPPCPAPGTNWRSIHREKKAAHSAKPLHFTQMIESYFPSLPRIELFKRGEPRPGWDYWGNEAPEELPPAAGTAAPERVESATPAAGDGERAHTPNSPSPAPASPEGAEERSENTSRPQREVRPGSTSPGIEQQRNTLGVAAGETAATPPLAEQAGGGSLPPATSLAEQDEVIREVYGRPGLPDFAEIERRTGRSRSSATKRAYQLGLSSRDRQRAAVAVSNKRRGDGGAS